MRQPRSSHLWRLDLSTEACSSVQQEVGRVLRKANPETPPKVIDIVDACGPLYAQFAKRKAFYLAQEFVIVDRNAPVPREMPFVLS